MSKVRINIKIKDFGSMELELYAHLAPNTVSNFIEYVKRGFFTHKTFHRIIPGFMIQGGRGDEALKAIKGEFEQNGFNNPLKHERGIISMARTNDPNSATTQFFIMHQNAPHLDGSYAAFGKVIRGIEVVDKIAAIKTNADDEPIEPIIIDSIQILENSYHLKPVEYL